jgi:hypothetical protein
MFSKKIRWLVGGVIGATALGLWLTAILLVRLPTWALVLLALALIASCFAYGVWHDAKRRRELDDVDELREWRDLRVIRTLSLHAESLETCTLTLELCCIEPGHRETG